MNKYRVACKAFQIDADGRRYVNGEVIATSEDLSVYVRLRHLVALPPEPAPQSPEPNEADNGD